MSRRLDIANALAAAVQAAPALAGAKFRRNPPDPANIKDGARVVFIEDQSDSHIDEKGQQGLRKYVFALGVINRSESPEDDADADHDAACDALREAANSLTAADNPTRLYEAQTIFKVEGVDVGGALILTTFELTYRRPKPAR